MPYKTKSGSHYHETYGCCGAMDACSTEGLEPCRICCGTRASDGAGSSGSATNAIGGSGGTPIPQGRPEAGLFAMPTGTPAGGMGTAESHDVRVTDIPTLCYEGTDDYVMRLADTLLAIKAGMDAARDGQYAPDSDEVSVTSDSLRAVLETLPQTLTSPVQMEEHEIAPEDIAGRPLSPREAFDQQRQEEFMEEFRQRTAETIRRWDEDEWQEWREAREDLAQYMKGNLRRERKPPYNMFIDEEVEALLRRRYEDANPCPSWHLALQWQRYGRLLHGREERWPGYDEARRKWDAESESIWQRLQTKKRPKNPDAPRAKVAVA